MPQDPFIGEISIFSFNYAPPGWLACAGQILQVNQYPAMFSVMGNAYGGNGSTNFALPDLRGCVPISFGTNPNTSTSYAMGQRAGTETVTLVTSQMPAHVHQLVGSSDPGDSSTPQNSMPANTGNLDKEYKLTATNLVTMNPNAMVPSGNGLPHPNMQPYVAFNFCIATSGIFPSRN